MTPLKQQVSLIQFSIEKGDNTLQQIAKMSIAATVISPFAARCYAVARPMHGVMRCLSVRLSVLHTIRTYNLLNSSNKRACSNTFVHVTLVSSTHNNGQKLQENVKSVSVTFVNSANRNKRIIKIFLPSIG